MDAPNFLRLLADGQLLIYVADAVSTSIRYLWLDDHFLPWEALLISWFIKAAVKETKER